MSRRFSFLVILTFFLVMTGASTYWFWLRTPDVIDGAEPGPLPADGKLHVLILGVDPGWIAPGQPGVGRSDTIMLATYDPKEGEVSLLSIPRDTRVEIPGREGRDKINHAYAYGGVQLAMQTVQNFLNVPIRYYITIDTNGFPRLVDTIGGVTIDVEKNMDWDDEAGNLHIHLKKGVQTLNGEDALGYVRYRHTDSDLARSQRQQKFIAAAIKQLLKPANLLKIPELIRIGFETVQTNIPFSVALRHAPAVASLKDKVNSYTIDGADRYIDGIYYYVPNMEKVEEMVEAYFYAGVDRLANSGVRVQLQYGNGSRQNANQVAELLRKNGFQVVSIREADGKYPVTQVFSVTDQTDGAVRVAEAITAQEVLLDPEAGTDVDVVVILGEDMLP
ncbi:MAG: LCP family protein [Bacillota bacterium]|jgi:LCP family protein required for cell wall assembly